MKILITGACGYVGSTLARSFLETYPEIIIYGLDSLIRPGSEINRSILHKLGINLFHGDIRNQSDIENLPKADWVIDCSASPSVTSGADVNCSSRQLFEHNLLGTLNILEYCKRHSSGLILLSSSRVYSIDKLTNLDIVQKSSRFSLDTSAKLAKGLSTAGINEEFSTTPPISLYGASKLASETVALEYGKTFGFPVQINRCGNLAGAGQFGRADQGIFSYWINAWIHNHPLSYFGYGGKGYQVRDCLHPRDLIPLFHKQMKMQSSPGQVLNLGGGIERSISLAELSNWCRIRYGESKITATPLDRQFDVPWIVMDSALAENIWGWKPQTSLDAILAEIADHSEKNPHWLQLSGMP